MRRENTTAWSSPTLRLDYGSDTANEPDIAIVVSRTLHSISRRHRIRCHRRARSASRAAANSPSGTITDTDTFTFDRAGRMLTAASGRYSNTVTYTFDPAGRKASEALTISSVTYTIGQAYNARNELTTVTYPDSSTSTRSYHATGALNQLALDGSTISTRSYDAGRRLTSEVLGNGITETRSYRNDNLLSGISYSDTSIGNLSYTWDANKNKTSETITGVMSGYGFTAAGTSYDFEDRLTGFSRASGTFTQAWNLTSVGDWTSVTTNGTAQSRTHGPTHELLTAGGSNVTTDVKGNITTLPTTLLAPGASTAMNLAWDFDNKMKSADIDANGSADVNFQYDALGRRVARTGTGGSTVYLQMDQQTIADYPVGGTASTPTYRYVYASYIDEPVVRKGAGTGGTILYYHRNQQFSITAITNSTGAVSERYAYTAYGQPTILDASGSSLSPQVSSLNNRYTYTGREWDATLGLHHFRARWMSPSAGRFLGRDPIGYRGNMPSLHAFIRGSVMNYVDPMGTDITVVPIRPQNQKTYLNPDCRKQLKADISWKFSLSEWPCKSDYGWFIQKVDVECQQENCNRGVCPGEQAYSYFEIWPVNKGSSLPQVTDTASFSPNLPKGSYKQTGTIRFYCGESVDRADLIEQRWQRGLGQPVLGETCCPTTSGALDYYVNRSDNRDLDDIPIWHKKGDVEDAGREFTMDWDCCDITKPCNADGNPKWSPEKPKKK